MVRLDAAVIWRRRWLRIGLLRLGTFVRLLWIWRRLLALVLWIPHDRPSFPHIPGSCVNSGNYGQQPNGDGTSAPS